MISIALFLENRRQVESRTPVGRWQPYGGEAVSRALFLHRTGGPSTGETVFVATGGRGDTEVHLHHALHSRT
jgi:hypothetical protein